MEKILLTDYKLMYPSIYNIHSITNEVSVSGCINKVAGYDDKGLWLDDQYGRLLKGGLSALYGDSNKMPYYYPQRIHSFEIIEHLRIPFRKIPIYRIANIEDINQLYNELKRENPGYEILLRGQTETYPIIRPKEDNLFLYGEIAPKEPSFHPSFLRSKFNEFFIYTLWHSLTEMLLHDVGIDLKTTLIDDEYKIYLNDVLNIKNSPHFTSISLGFAQHYGLPSVGLDLTDDLKVAGWFASHKLSIDEYGVTTPTLIDDFSESTIFFLKCPKDTVFQYDQVKPKFLTNTRPDRQRAWFGHCGWGMAKNQLASYLVCGVRVNPEIHHLFDKEYAKFLFPSRSEDFVLDFFLNMKENFPNKGEVKRALDRIYHFGN